MQKVNLNLIPGSVLPVINVSQYDEGRQFQLAIFNGAASYDLTGKTVMVDVQKTDGHGCEYGTADEVRGVPVVAVSGNIVTITTPQQMTACAGDCAGELKITDSTSTIGTLNFVLMCEPAPLNDETIISDTELPAIIDAARSSAERAEDAAQDAEAAAAHYPYIGDDGYWYEWDVETEQFVKTNVSAAGRAPDITMTATADATSSPTPTVTVTKTGTDEEPNFALAFSGLKGPKGDTGPIGPTGDSQDVLEAVGWVGSNLFYKQVAGHLYGTDANGYALSAGTNSISFIAEIKAGQTYVVSKSQAGNRFRLVGFMQNPETTKKAQSIEILDPAAREIYSNNSATEYTFTNTGNYNYVVLTANAADAPSGTVTAMISRNGGSYVPYHPTVQEELWDGEVAEPKNLLSCEAMSIEVSSLTATKYFDDIGRLEKIRINGSNTSGVAKNIQFSSRLADGAMKFSTIGTYVYSIGVTLPPNVNLIVSYMSPSTGNLTRLGMTSSNPLVFTVTDDAVGQPCNITFNTDNNTTLTNFDVYPMVCSLEDWNKSHAYSPYYIPLKDVVPTKFNSSNVAPTEDGAGVSQAYSTGQYLIHNGELRKATTAIASGAAITDNNTDATTLAEILELNNNELASGIATFDNPLGLFDMSNATLDCVVNRFTRRVSIRFDGIVTLQQLSVAVARSIITIATGYYGLIGPFGLARAIKDNTYYQAQLSKNTLNSVLALTPQETIPAGAAIYGYIEWPY